MLRALTYAISSLLLTGTLYALFRFLLQGERSFEFNRTLLLTFVGLSLALPAISFFDFANVKKDVMPAPSRSVTKYLNEKLGIAMEMDKYAGFNTFKGGQREYFYISNLEDLGKDFLITKKRIVKIFPYGLAILCAYVLGGVLLFIRFWMGILRIKKMSKGAKISRNGKLTIYEIDEPIAPFSFWNSVYIPSGVYDEREKSQILLHERAHIKRNHSLDLLVLEFVCSFVWFNPFLRLFKRSAIELHEYAADAVTLSEGVAPEEYGEILFKNLCGQRLFVSSNYLNKDQIKRRLRMFTKTRMNSLTPIKYVFAVLSTLALGVIFSFSQKIEPTPDPLNNARVELFEVDPVINIDNELPCAFYAPIGVGAAERELRKYVAKDALLRKIAHRKGAPVEIIAHFTVDSLGYVHTPTRIMISEANGKNTLDRKVVEANIKELIEKMPKLKVRERKFKCTTFNMGLYLSFCNFRNSAYAANFKEPKPVMYPNASVYCDTIERYLLAHPEVQRKALEAGITAKVIVDLFVDTSGRFFSPEIKRYKIAGKNWNEGELYPGCKEDALKIVKSLPRIDPIFFNRGSQARINTFSIPIIFGSREEWNNKTGEYLTYFPIKSGPVSDPNNRDSAYAYASMRTPFIYSEILEYYRLNTIYPWSVKDRSKKGSVLVSYEVNGKGDIVNIKIERGMGKPFDDEAIRVIKSSRPFYPLRYGPRGIKLRTNFDFN